MRWILIGLIRLYQRFCRPFIPPVCRFEPSCSDYFLQALQKRGLLVGFALGCWRLLRCQPFARGGYDPVPEAPGRGAPGPATTEGTAAGPAASPAEAPNAPKDLDRPDPEGDVASLRVG